MGTTNTGYQSAATNPFLSHYGGMGTLGKVIDETKPVVFLSHYGWMGTV